jgi:plastocyanin
MHGEVIPHYSVLVHTGRNVMHPRKLLILVATFVMVVGGSSVAVGATRTAAAESAQVDTTAVVAEVNVVTDFVFVPGESLELDFYFDPATIDVQPGDQVRWVQVGPDEEPHTVTVVNKDDLPQTFEEADACFAEDAPCGEALAAHFPEGEEGPVVPRVNVGRDGLDQPGDSLWLEPEVGNRISAEITAPAGTTLYYLCALHPWMQGSINVK